MTASRRESAPSLCTEFGKLIGGKTYKRSTTPLDHSENLLKRI
ncbi:MAG: hypothetical protein ABSB56_03005 [Nitrososphaerales archaeon]